MATRSVSILKPPGSRCGARSAAGLSKCPSCCRRSARTTGRKATLSRVLGPILCRFYPRFPVLRKLPAISFPSVPGPTCLCCPRSSPRRRVNRPNRPDQRRAASALRRRSLAPSRTVQERKKQGTSGRLTHVCPSIHTPVRRRCAKAGRLPSQRRRLGRRAQKRRRNRRPLLRQRPLPASPQAPRPRRPSPRLQSRLRSNPSWLRRPRRPALPSPIRNRPRAVPLGPPRPRWLERRCRSSLPRREDRVWGCCGAVGDRDASRSPRAMASNPTDQRTARASSVCGTPAGRA